MLDHRIRRRARSSALRRIHFDSRPLRSAIVCFHAPTIKTNLVCSNIPVPKKRQARNDWSCFKEGLLRVVQKLRCGTKPNRSEPVTRLKSESHREKCLNRSIREVCRLYDIRYTPLATKQPEHGYFVRDTSEGHHFVDGAASLIGAREPHRKILSRPQPNTRFPLSSLSLERTLWPSATRRPILRITAR